MKTNEVVAELERSIEAALETYSNVHRGSGQNSLVSTELFERSRLIVLQWLGLSEKQYTVIFCTPFRANQLTKLLGPGTFRTISSQEFDLPFGVVALAVKKNALPKGVPYQSGGGTVKIVSPDHVLWANAPDKFEAGTPAIINVIAFARALQLAKISSNDCFAGKFNQNISADQVLSSPEFDRLSGESLLKKIKASLLGKHLEVPTETGLRHYTNLDNGASTPTFQPVWEASRKTLSLSRENRANLIRVCQTRCLDFLDAPEKQFEIIFASNTSEAINIAAMNFAKLQMGYGSSSVIVNSILEHNSNELPWRYVPDCSLIRVNVDGEGFIEIEKLKGLLKEYNEQKKHGSQRIRLIAVSGASNVLGSFNDINLISSLAHKYGALILVDAAQLIAHRKISMVENQIDMLVFSAHKAYAPFGSGGLVIRKDLLKIEDSMTNRLRDSGNQNLMGIVALTKMLSLFQQIGMDVVEEDEKRLTERFLNQLSRLPGIKIYGVCDPSSPRLKDRSGVITLSFERIPFNLAANRLAEIGGIGVRSGCFCAHLLGKQLLGFSDWRAFLADIGFRVLPKFTKNIIPGLVRISIGLENDEKDIDQVVNTIKALLEEPRRKTELFLASAKHGLPFYPRVKIQTDLEKYVLSRENAVFGME